MLQSIYVIQPEDIVLVIAGICFLFGLLTFIIGLSILIRVANGKELETIAKNTQLIAKKGIGMDVSGVVNSLSVFIGEASQIIKTKNGIGSLLLVIGLAMIGGSFWAILNLFGM